MGRSITTRPGALLLLLLTGALAAIEAHANWPQHAASGGVALCTNIWDQTAVAIAPDGAGGAIATWRDNRGGAFIDKVYAQRVSATGVPLWTPDGVEVCPVGPGQLSPAILADGSGGALIAWQDFRNGNYDIYVQRLDASGALQYGAGGLQLCGAANAQTHPVIVSDGGNGAIVLWYDLRTSPQIFGQRLDYDLGPQWAVNGQLCAAIGGDFFTAIADGAGGVILTWATTDILAQRVGPTGFRMWTDPGASICLAAGAQDLPEIAPDGAGGAIITWRDHRGGAPGDTYAQRVSPQGATYWTPNGVAVCTHAADQELPVIASDGAGGAIIAWPDLRNVTSDVFAQRVNSSGVVQWAANGVSLCTAAGAQTRLEMVPDDAGGAVVTWEDGRDAGGAPLNDIYAQRVLPSGASAWGATGAAVCIAPQAQVYPFLCRDGAGGTVLTWFDARSNVISNYDIYAQRIDDFGYLGMPQPELSGIRDVPNDQGGKVRVAWNASYLDAPPYVAIDSYWVLRSVPAAAAAAAVARGARVLTDFSSVPAAGTRTFLALGAQTSGYAWEFVVSQPAFHLSSYGVVAPTTSDSIDGSNPTTAFMVMARTAGGAQYWFSAPDSGYSVDNLAPVLPAPFTGAYSMGATHLHWSPNLEPDLAGYRLHRGNSAAFVPGPGNLVATPPDTGYSDPGPAGRYYKLAAADAHGNIGPYALLTPQQTLDVPGAGVPVTFLATPEPNPSSGPARFRFAVATRAEVRLDLFDPLGRRVRALASGLHAAGEHEARWDGNDEGGRPAPGGLYFVRLVSGREIRTARVLRVR